MQLDVHIGQFIEHLLQGIRHILSLIFLIHVHSRYLAYFPPGKRSKNGEEQRMSEMQYLFQTGACGLQVR